MIAGMLVSFVLAAFSIKYFVDQIIVGVVLNVLVAGLTSFLYSTVLTRTPALNNPPQFPRINIPGLSEIPIIGPVLFRQTIIVYIMYVTVAAVWFGLFHTKWGLRLRSTGEHPQAADTVGINVNRTRFWNVSLAGVDRRDGRRVLHAHLGRGVQQGDDQRRRVHRPGRRDLRPLAAAAGDHGRTAVRLREQPAERARGDRLAACRASSC